MTLGTDPSGTAASTNPMTGPILPIRVTPIPSDLSNTSIVVRRISDTGWKDHADLDLTVNNWPTWHKRVVMVLQLCGGLDLYLIGKTAEPDANLEPRANENWLINDAAVHAFIKTRCSSTELAFIDGCPTALSTWTTLQTHHQCQGTVSQIHLMQEAFTIKYSTSTPFSDTSERLRTLNDRIWAMGSPTTESFLVILMLLALSPPELRGIRDAVITGLASASSTSPYTAANIRSRLDLEQQVRNAKSHVSIPTEALVAKDSRSPTICANCKKDNHLAEFCVRKGGGMAGKSVDDAMAAQREFHRGKTSSSKPKKTYPPPSSTTPSFSKDTSQKGGLPVVWDSQN